MRRFFSATLVMAALALSTSALAQDARPALWTVHGPKGTIYLMSSLHLLPPNINWHRADIDAAMRSADSFVFEVPTDPAENEKVTKFIIENGLLPAGQLLHKKLSDAALNDFHKALWDAGMEERSLDQKQPWLVEIMLTLQSMHRRNYSSLHTPETEAQAFADQRGRNVRYLDTTLQQLEFLQDADRSDGVDRFSAMLADFPNQPGREMKLVSAWASGDVDASATLIAKGLQDLPVDEQLLAERNRDWTRQLESMLGEGHTFFATVGIAHLVGPTGVPSLLRKDGIRVDGP